MGARILIVDDEETLTFFLQRSLSAVRPSDIIESVRSATDALARLDVDTYDLVIVDQRLPDASGFSVLHRARRQTPPASSILMTGYVSEALEDAARQAGASGCLTKPFDIHTARRLVEHCLHAQATEGD